MKKLIVILMLLSFGQKIYSQTFNIEGEVLSVWAQPIPKHPIYFMVPDMNLYDTIYSDTAGFYNIQLQLDTSNAGSLFFLDAQDNCVEEPYVDYLNPETITHNFQICSMNDTGYCFADFDYISTEPYVYRFENLSEGVDPYYLWDFGDGYTSSQRNPVHTFPQEGSYKVSLSIITVDSCESYFEQIITPRVIKGKVYAGNQLLTLGKAYMLQPGVQSTSYSTLLDSAGMFQFLFPYNGNYRIYVKPQITNLPHVTPLYFPTYFGDSLLWQQGVEINTYEDTIPELLVNLPSRSELFFGHGTITGTLDFKLNAYYSQPYYCLLLTDTQGEPKAYTYTNESMEFEFNDIPWGEYILHLDTYGLLSQPLPLVLSEDKPEETVHFALKDSIITHTTTSKQESISIYPNPVGKHIVFKGDLSSYHTLEIYNLYGQQVLAVPVSQEIEVSHLSKGFYVLRAIGNTQEKSLKFLKE